jgi:hypothetical protein
MINKMASVGGVLRWHSKVSDVNLPPPNYLSILWVLSHYLVLAKPAQAWSASRLGSTCQHDRHLHGTTAAQRFSQDRVTDGQLLPSGGQPLSRPDTYVIGTPLAGSAAPEAPPLEPSQLEQLIEMLQNSRGALVLTGAGASTESDIPDYRSPGGAYSTGFKPMTHQAFLASPQNRSRYWARSFAGWGRFSQVQPNAAHAAIARLQRVGWVEEVVTQNVDRLHQKAGSAAHAVLELHGTTHEVICMSCHRVQPRDDVQCRLAELNPGAAEAAEALARDAGAEDERRRMLRAGTAEPVPPGLKVGGLQEK